MKNNLTELRMKIDSIDDQLAALFKERMEIVDHVAEAKKASGKAVTDRIREKSVISRIVSKTDPSVQNYMKVLFSVIFNLSKSSQNLKMVEADRLSKSIKEALASTDKKFPISTTVACQGIEGSYSQLAADKLFQMPNILFFKNFDAVFHAVEKGLCRYGILPIENSDNGSVAKVYDLMKERNFYIVKSAKMKIDHCLLSKTGVALEDIKTIYSHDQALGQCSKFLDNLPGVELKVCENTAQAAKIVSESDDNSIAAISSRDCADLYGLKILSDNIQNTDNNYTRFICISKKMEVYPGADKVSIMLTLPHKSGSLYELMSQFAAIGLNLTKLESRPISGRDFEFMFYFDFEASVYDEDVLHLLDGLSNSLEQFKFLGSYTDK